MLDSATDESIENQSQLLAPPSTIVSERSRRRTEIDRPPFLDPPTQAGPGHPTHLGQGLPLRNVERTCILDVLWKCGGNRSRAAQVLGLDRKTLKEFTWLSDPTRTREFNYTYVVAEGGLQSATRASHDDRIGSIPLSRQRSAMPLWNSILQAGNAGVEPRPALGSRDCSICGSETVATLRIPGPPARRIVF